MKSARSREAAAPRMLCGVSQHNPSAEERKGGSGWPKRSPGWFRALRTPDALELLRAGRCAFILAYVIAYRAHYSAGFSPYNLALGEALLGDYRAYGMTEQEYRTAKLQLKKWGFATFKATTSGTVAKLTDTRLFAIFRLPGNDQDNEQVTDSQRTANGRPTTIKISKNKKIDKSGKDPANFIPQ
jgi:hypothetical protein